MKNTILLLFIICISNTTFAINFFQGNYTEAFAFAQKQNKPLFIYFRAEWNVSCKKMENEAFPDSVLTKFTDDNFVLLQINGVSEANKSLRNKLGIGALPSFLVLNQQEKIIKFKHDINTLSAFKEFLEDALKEIETDGLAALESQTVEAFNKSRKTPDDYSWSSYNLIYIINKPELALTLMNDYKPKGGKYKHQAFTVMLATAKKAGIQGNVAQLNEIGQYASKIGFGGREFSMLKVAYFLENQNLDKAKEAFLEFSNNQDRFNSDFAHTGLLFDFVLKNMPEYEQRFNNSAFALELLESMQKQYGNFERVYPERAFKYHKALMLAKSGKDDEAKTLVKEILPSYAFVPADVNYGESLEELGKIIEERE
jgi:thiol-disulfide isomerase/thioredoxin